MRENLYHTVSYECSKMVTKKYSTSFSMACKMLSPKIRNHIYNIYGFVRFTDEIVDSFHEYDKETLLSNFESDYYKAVEEGISLNPIINSFVHTVKKYEIPNHLVKSFLESMRTDLHKKDYLTEDAYKKYIYGSADVIGLMCLKVFVNGNEKEYNRLKEPAMRLGSAFQKVNFLRDLKDDFEDLNRSYFPNIDLNKLDGNSKNLIIQDIQSDFDFAYKNGVLELPVEAKLGVYIAFRYYKRLLSKLKKVHYSKILETRVRVSNLMKINLLVMSYLKFKINLI